MHSELLRIGPLTIHSYGVMLALAFLAGILWARREARAAGMPPEWILDAGVYVIVLSILFGRLLYVILDINYYLQHPSEIINIQMGGLSLHGGVAGGALGVMYFCWRRKVGVFKFGELVIPSLALGTAIGRIGCFLNGCCHGKSSVAPWAIALPELKDGGILRHPTQLYESLLCLLLFFFLLFMKRYRRKDGDLFAFYLMGYSVVRFVVEFYRAGASSVIGWIGFTYAQWLSIAVFVFGMFLWRRKQSK
ncbi:MAG: prolipoprotein diacylglyceryl transferase [bacterium]